MGDSEVDLLYRFTKELLTNKPEPEGQTLEDAEKEYDQKIKSSATRTHIVHSAAAGDGKST